MLNLKDVTALTVYLFYGTRSLLQGDYRTGKRLNMKKIIPYIASDFRKDKIWLRRTKPNQRKYQVILAIDDSRSMAERKCGHVAMEAMTLLCRAMARLEVYIFRVTCTDTVVSGEA